MDGFGSYLLPAQLTQPNRSYDQLTLNAMSNYDRSENVREYNHGATAVPQQGQPGRLPEFFTDNLI